MTVILPVIPLWIVQWYRKVPARRNRRRKVSPGDRLWFHAPVFDVVVWVRLPPFTHRTTSPRATVRFRGRNALSTIRTRTTCDAPLGPSVPAARSS